MMDVIAKPSANYNDRANGQIPSMIIIHYTGTQTADEASTRFCDSDPQDAIGRISPHYMIDGDGAIIQFVDETKRAWHAGLSKWHDQADINSASIGIEIWNTGHEYRHEDFLPCQITTLIDLIQDIRTRWVIADRNILGHSDIAPGRKLDPGEKFPWDQLAQQHIGLMPRPGAVRHLEKTDFFKALEQYGYTYTPDHNVLLREFRRHFLPQRLTVEGLGDEDCMALASLMDQAII